MQQCSTEGFRCGDHWQQSTINWVLVKGFDSGCHNKEIRGRFVCCKSLPGAGLGLAWGVRRRWGLPVRGLLAFAARREKGGTSPGRRGVVSRV